MRRPRFALEQAFQNIRCTSSGASPRPPQGCRAGLKAQARSFLRLPSKSALNAISGATANANLHVSANGPSTRSTDLFPPI
jgi:hypothetical protein